MQSLRTALIPLILCATFSVDSPGRRSLDAQVATATRRAGFANQQPFGGPRGPARLPALSGDGTIAAFSTTGRLFSSDSNQLDDVYLRDLTLQRTWWLSEGPNHAEPNGPSGVWCVDMSSDGRYVVYDSRATNLVSTDTNGASDIFLRDRSLPMTLRVSVASNGTEANGDSFHADVSDDGRFVAFSSEASNLVPNDTNGERDVFVKDRQRGSVVRVSVGVNNRQGDAASGITGIGISADGRYVVFDSAATTLAPDDTNGHVDVFLHDRATGRTQLVSRGAATIADGPSAHPAIAADGSAVAFGSRASNLVAGDTNNRSDVFRYKVSTRTIRRVSVATNGAEADGPCGAFDVAISGDGDVIAFDAFAPSLVDVAYFRGRPRVVVRDERRGTTTGRTIGSSHETATEGVALSRTGRVVAYTWLYSPIDPAREHVVVDDASVPPVPSPVGGTLTTIAPTGGTPMISANGRYVAYDDGVQVLRVDRQTGQVALVSADVNGARGNSVSKSPHLSADGRFVAFESAATNLVPGDTNAHVDIFVKDMLTGAIVRANVSTTGAQAIRRSEYPTLSADGRYVSFTSDAENLVPNDMNQLPDVFVRDLVLGTTSIESVDSNGAYADGGGARARLSADGRFIVFESQSTNLGPNPRLRRMVYRRDRTTGETLLASATNEGQPPMLPAQSVHRSFLADISANGRFVVFASTATDLAPPDRPDTTDIFLRDMVLGTTKALTIDERIQAVFVDSTRPSISPNGRWITFTSRRPSLVADDRNGLDDVFIHDRLTEVTRRVSVDNANVERAESSGSNVAAPHTPVCDTGAVVFRAWSTQAGSIVVRETLPRLSAISAMRPGSIGRLALYAPNDRGLPYQIGVALRYEPGISIDTRVIPLTFDALTYFSLTAPAVWMDFKGRIDAEGHAAASIRLPGDPRLDGVSIYCAFVTLDPAAPSGVRSISNALRIQLDL